MASAKAVSAKVARSRAAERAAREELRPSCASVSWWKDDQRKRGGREATIGGDGIRGSGGMGAGDRGRKQRSGEDGGGGGREEGKKKGCSQWGVVGGGVGAVTEIRPSERQG